MVARRSEKELGALPAEARSFEGASFDPRSDHWRFRSGVHLVSIDFREVTGCSANLASSLRCVILWYVENRSSDLARSIFDRLLHFLRSQREGVVLSQITAADLTSYRAGLEPSQRWYLTTLSGAFRRWHQFGYPGVADDAYELLRRLRLKGNRKGEAVRSACPIKGPLSDIEFTGLVAAIARNYREGLLSREHHLLALLCICFGLRPVQLAALKVTDLISDGSGCPTHLCVPRAKQPGQLIRSEFKSRPLLPALAAELMEHALDVQGRFSERCPAGPPLFPSAEAYDIWGPGFEWHPTPLEIGARIRSSLTGLEVHSERTGLPMRVSAIRLRRTFGTRVAIEGGGLMVVAEALDHSDLQSAEVYIEARPDILDRITEASASILAPLARAFAGEVSTEDLVQAGTRARGHISDPSLGSQRPLGQCRSTANCRLAAPTGCYTCPSFRAWVDGPHREVLQHLLQERERLASIASGRVAAVNDRTILAVAEVVQLCEAAEHG